MKNYFELGVVYLFKEDFCVIYEWLVDQYVVIVVYEVWSKVVVFEIRDVFSDLIWVFINW